MSEKIVTQPGGVRLEDLIDDYEDNQLKKDQLSNTINEMTKMVFAGDYVLVIGSRGIIDGSKFDDNMLHGIDDADRMMLQIARASTRRSMPDLLGDTFNDFNTFCHRLTAKAKLIYGRTFDNCRLGSECINQSVVRLLRSKAFRVVLCTTQSPIVERIMRDTWGDALKVCSISGNKNSYDISVSEKIDGENSLMPPTLYYIFGRPDATNTDYALNDNEKIEKVKVWLSKEAPKNILEHVWKKKLFAYGCKFDDWFFRFLWHTFRNKNNIEGDVALPFDIDHSEEDRRLHDYLSSCNVKIVDEPELYISMLADKIEASLTEFTGRSNIEPDKFHRHVFISYTHRDYVNAMRIYKRLADEKIPVWLDHYKLGGGDEFDKEINNGIESCGVFLPILSSNVRTDSEKILAWKNDSSLPEPKENQSYYRVNEWTRGCDANVEWKVIPVATFGYDYTKDYHYQVVPEKMRAVTVFDWTKQPVSELVEQIEKALNRTE